MASSARLDELKKKFDENPRRYFAPLANEHRKSGDLDQAISLCRTHLPLQPGHISGHIVLAQALFEAGSLDESRDIFHTALGLDPENLIALRYLGDIAKESHDIETARSWYQRVLEVDPRNDEIEQLVRDLDAPPPAAAETSADEPPSIESFAPSDAPPSAPPPSAVQENDARFAPLSLDTVDIDDSFGAPPAEPNETPGAPLLDTPGIDPFDLDPAGSVDALLEPHAESSSDDFFLTELSGPQATADSAEPAESWTQANSAEANAAPAPADAELDESSFYLEPPPAEPAPTSEYDGPPSASTEPASVGEVPAEQPSIPGLDAFAAEYSTGSYEAIPEPEPNEAAMESLAEQATAEWHAESPEVVAPSGSSTPDDGLGLEVMEFVPPARDEQPPAALVPEADADPLMGHMLPAMTNEQSATPAAFVTETMAELYLQQGFRNEALAVYRELLSKNPADESLRDRIEQIENGSVSSIGMASVSGDVVESALKRHAGRPARSVRSFFASLASRRAPAPRDDAAMAAGEVPYEPAVEETQLQSAAASEAEYATPVAPMAEAEPVVEAAVEPVVEPAIPARPDRITPLMSAAETLASFDPFADSAEAEPTLSSAFDTDAIPNEPLAEFANGIVSPPPARQTPLSSPAQAQAPDPTAPPEPPARRSLEDLFPDTPVAPRTESAAETLATAFGRGEPQGRPTRAASNELSLDHVFRGAPEGAPPAGDGFSFDQFFSDTRAAGTDASPAASAPESGRSSAPSDAHDIEQFTAWLEGLKKK